MLSWLQFYHTRPSSLLKIKSVILVLIRKITYQNFEHSSDIGTRYKESLRLMLTRSWREVFQVDGDTILGPQGEDINGSMPVIFRDGEAEVRKKHGQNNLGFHGRKALANAVARTRCEWQKISG